MEKAKLSASLEQAERLLSQGALQDAEALYREILDDTPGEPKASQGLALIALHTGHASAAVELLQVAAIGLPEDASIATHLGLAFASARDIGSAESCYRKALELSPNYADAHLNLANLLLESGRTDEAAEEYETAIRLAPNNGAVHYGRAMLEIRRGETDSAISALEQALTHAPALLPARVNLATLFLQTGRHEDAVSHLREAVSYAPESFDARLNLCAALQQINHTAEAVEVARGALALAPESPELLLNLSSAETGNGQPEDAWRTLDRALGIASDYAPAKLNRGMVRLLLADMPDAWEDYEARPSRAALPHPGIAQIAEWKGEALTGQTILVWAEQGFGDTIQFCRFLPRLKALGARVLLDVQRPLGDILQRFDGLDDVVIRNRDTETQAADFQIPLLSLMRRLEIDLQDIEITAPYISAPAETIRRWQSQEENTIGLCWQGSVTNPNDHRRSIPALELIQPLGELALPSIGLQYGIDDAPIENPGALVTDFAELAAIIEQLDLVISVDTSVAHLAGAMGKDVWVMLPYAPDWRWMTDRTDSPWYPTMRLYRQSAPGDWHGVISAITEALSTRYSG